MRSYRKLAAVPVLALALVGFARDTSACGGDFAPPGQNTEVASHKMAFSVSTAQSTLYDQIQYTGDPASFAWVLPYKGNIQIGVSSDILFEQLDTLTTVTVTPPDYCSCENGDSSGFSDSSSSGGVGGAGTGGGVTVIAQMAVGPYDTVQLSSSDPNALTTWLTMNGYAIPANIDPTITAYVNEGFDFLALKLQPGMGVQAMQPVRVTTPGAGLTLPLRMVAAGVGASVPITLYVLAEGRYEPTNFPVFTIPQNQIVWDFSANTSNYATLENAGFASTMSTGWLVEETGPMSEQSVTSPILQTAQFDPMDSGYADSMGNNAGPNAQADLDVLFSGINAPSLWVTRLFAELPVAALSSDITLGASADQSVISPNIQATQYKNPFPCPCMGGAGGAGVGTSVGVGGAGGAGAGGAAGSGGSGGGSSMVVGGCDVGGGTETPATLGGVLAALALAAARRRRRVA
jgi:MYXO-CTERM domain-containing protein